MSRIAIIALLFLVGCDQAPTETDMEGCAIRGRGPPISAREVADCAVDRAERKSAPSAPDESAR